jgi:hypothetical protein
VYTPKAVLRIDHAEVVASSSPPSVRRPGAMSLSPTKRAPSKYIACTAWLDASLETRVDQATRVRGNWSAYGTGSVINL